MGSQLLNLKWCNHHSNLLTVFSKLLTSESFTDVTLVGDGASIRAHKIILSACSPFFYDVFSKHPCQNPIIILKDVSHTDLKMLVDFIYNGEVNIAQECLPSFLQVAKSLKIKGLAEKDTSTNKSKEQPSNQESLTNRCKRFKSSNNVSDNKTNDSSLDKQDNVYKDVEPQDEKAPNCTALAIYSPDADNCSYSPTQRFEQVHNWGTSSLSSKFVEVNMQEDETLIAGQSECLDQDDPTDLVEIYNDSPQDSKPAHLSPNNESIEHISNTGPMNTTNMDVVSFSESFGNGNDYMDSSIGPGCYPETGQSEETMQEEIPAPTGHVLTKLPPHKKKDCIVCGNRQAGQRRRSRQWCPGCNVGVHVHCFEKLEHYRRSKKRTPRPPNTKTVEEFIPIKTEPYDEITIESANDSESESNVQIETITGEIG